MEFEYNSIFFMSVIEKVIFVKEALTNAYKYGIVNRELGALSALD